MLIHELTKAECEAVLQRTNLGRLACARNNQPYIVPIYFDFDGSHLYSFATLGQKIQWMRINPRVCVEVDNIADQFQWTTVVVLGRYQELRTPDHEDLKLRAEELFKKRQNWWLPGAGKTPSSEHGVPVIFRITIDRISGRRAAGPKATLTPSKSMQAKAPAWWMDVVRPRRK